MNDSMLLSKVYPPYHLTQEGAEILAQIERAKLSCRHRRVHIVYSPDEGIYYGECRSGCWQIGPSASTSKAALAAFRAFYTPTEIEP